MAALMGSGADTHTAGSSSHFLGPLPRPDRSTRANTCTVSSVTSRVFRTTPIHRLFFPNSGPDRRVDLISGKTNISSAPYAYYSVYRIAKGEVKVILSGNGGDEATCGVSSLFPDLLESAMDQRHFLARTRSAVGKGPLQALCPRNFLAKRRPGGQRPFADAGLPYCRPGRSGRVRLPTKPQLERPSGRRCPQVLDPEPVEIRRQELDGLLDRSRIRLDHELVEFIFQLPIDQKIKRGWNRYVYRQAMQGKMPETNRTRRSKIGFTNPEAAWTTRTVPL